MSLFAARPRKEARAITSVPWYPTDLKSDAGVNVNDRTALQLSAVWACISLITDLIASMPLDVFTDRNGAPVKVENPPSFITKPSLRGLTRREWTAQALHSALLRGNTFGVKMGRDRSGSPLAIEWVCADNFSVEEVNSLALPVYRLDGQVVPIEDVVHLRANLVPGSVVGLSPIEFQAQTIGIGIAAQKFGAQWFGQGAHPSASDYGSSAEA